MRHCPETENSSIAGLLLIDKTDQWLSKPNSGTEKAW